MGDLHRRCLLLGRGNSQMPWRDRSLAAPIEIALNTDDPLWRNLVVISGLQTAQPALYVWVIRRAEPACRRENGGAAEIVAIPFSPAVANVAADVATGPTPHHGCGRRRLERHVGRTGGAQWRSDK